jgi:hypothetical protein
MKIKLNVLIMAVNRGELFASQSHHFLPQKQLPVQIG